MISAFISHSSEVTQMSKVILTLQWAALLKTKLLLSHILLEMLCDPFNSSIIKRSALWDDLQWYSELYGTHFLGSLGTKGKCQCQLLLESSVIVECINLDTFLALPRCQVTAVQTFLVIATEVASEMPGGMTDLRGLSSFCKLPSSQVRCVKTGH